MIQMIERTLILLKPDAVQRGLMGKIITRFEDAGVKVIGMKMVWVDEEFAKKHYTEDIAKRRGEKVREQLLQFIREGPVVVMCLEGIQVVENVRKMVGETEPKSAQPGTIRGDFAHMSFSYADKTDKAVPNLIHASGDKKDAEYEIKLWFTEEELHNYTTVHELHVF